MTRVVVAVDEVVIASVPAALLEADDVICVAGGGKDVEELASLIRLARRKFEGLEVWISTGPRRLGERAGLAASRVLVDWEPHSVDGTAWGPWSWEQGENVRALLAATGVVRGRLGLLVTGVPLTNRKLRREGVAWDYGLLTDCCEGPVIVQTQGQIHRSPAARLVDKVRGNTPFEEALGQLHVQHGGSAARLEKLGMQVAFGGVPAAVSAETAVKAVRTAGGYGVGTVYLFGKDARAVRRFLERLGR